MFCGYWNPDGRFVNQNDSLFWNNWTDCMVTEEILLVNWFVKTKNNWNEEISLPISGDAAISTFVNGLKNEATPVFGGLIGFEKSVHHCACSYEITLPFSTAYLKFEVILTVWHMDSTYFQPLNWFSEDIFVSHTYLNMF